MMAENVDILIRRGRVIDSATNFDKVADVAIKNGLVYSIGEDLGQYVNAVQTFDAGQCIVTAGLVDIHVHAYKYCTPLGIDIDELCLNRGVTTAVDAGSAGVSTLMGLRKFIAETSRTNLFAFLNISALGLASAGVAGHGFGGENDSLTQLDIDACVESVRDNSDLVVGIKVRLTADCCDEGKNEEEAYSRALEAAKQANVPLMVNHHFSTIPTSSQAGSLSCPGDMNMGDVYTHCFHGFSGTIVDARSRAIYRSVLEAQNRGVLFDIGHGKNSFSWTVAEFCAKESFWPDIISTDMHFNAIQSYENDLLNVMTKMHHVGMPLTYIIKAVTLTPAKVIRKKVGTLRIGYPADVVVLKLEDCDRRVPDSQSQIRSVSKEFVLKAIWKDGEWVEVREPNHFYSDPYFYEQAKDWPRLRIHDSCPPCPAYLQPEIESEMTKSL